MKSFTRFKAVADVCLIILMALAASSALCQTVGIEGQGSSELMEYIKRIVSFIF